MKITHQQVLETDPHVFVAEASELGIAPGVFLERALPTVIDTDLGNGQPFIMHRYTHEAVTFVQSNGCISLVIYND